MRLGRSLISVCSFQPQRLRGPGQCRCELPALQRSDPRGARCIGIIKRGAAAPSRRGYLPRPHQEHRAAATAAPGDVRPFRRSAGRRHPARGGAGTNTGAAVGGLGTTWRRSRAVGTAPGDAAPAYGLVTVPSGRRALSCRRRVSVSGYLAASCSLISTPKPGLPLGHM